MRARVFYTRGMTDRIDRAARARKIIDLSVRGFDLKKISKITGLAESTVKLIRSENEEEILARLRGTSEEMDKSLAQYQLEALSQGIKTLPRAMQEHLTILQNSKSERVKLKAVQMLYDVTGLIPKNAPAPAGVEISQGMSEDTAKLLVEAIENLPSPPKELTRGEVESFSNLSLPGGKRVNQIVIDVGELRSED